MMRMSRVMNPEWTTGDGIYEVLIDASTGIVVDIIYDSGLNGNG